MKMQNVIKELFQKEKNKKRKMIFNLLLEHSNKVETAKNNKFKPLLLINKGRILFLYQDLTTKDEFLFYKEEEIENVLRDMFLKNERIYLDIETQEKKLSKDLICKKINDSLKNNDEKSFIFFSSLLKN